ncbi:tetraspanin 37 isoform X1 [Melanotaenia boesemani]|uniref:tetraspanin 37 isoform X1 n=2 Tax=Melanotaenia boesemani TaxID=1250792 RepID=UPI001C04FDA9|nr:tetraspanin 37 isoform X1 [Melanotaenia boesemani]
MCGERRNTVRTILQLTCHLLWVVGLAVGLSGVYLLMKYRQNSLFFSQPYITLPGILALCSAALLIFTGRFGLCINFRNSPCLQGLFIYLLVMVFCLESTTSVLAYYHSIKIDSDTAPLREVFQKYTGNSQDLNSRAFDATQDEFQCCGVSNYTDWMKTSWFNQTGGTLVPHTCCNTSFPSCNGTVNQPWQLYPQGCQVKLEMAFQFVLSFIIWGFVVVFLIEVLLLLTVAQLMKQQQFVGFHVLGKT